MTGTSLDALDAALVAVAGRGLTLRAAVQRFVTRELGPLREPLRALALQRRFTAGEIASTSRDFAFLHAEVLRELAAGQRLDLIAIHGQTVFHAPPASWQLFSPAIVAQELQTPVVFDLRAADLAAGGQGAPITPLADYVFFRHERETRAVLNLGGYCNFTLLPGADWTAIRGGDICACNHLLDGLARKLLAAPFDAGGRRALAGRVETEPYAALVAALHAQSALERSLGTGDELAGWSKRFEGGFAPHDLARSACEAIATVVAEKLGRVERLIVAGGGVRNQALLDALRARTGAALSLSDELDVPAQAREAAAMAVLGALCADRVPITLPQITGCSQPAPCAGAWVYPPAGGSTLPYTTLSSPGA